MRTGTRWVVGVGALAVVLAGCTGSGSRPGPDPWTDQPPGGGALGLVAFDSCGSALKDLKTAAAPYVGPYGLVGAGWGDFAVAGSGAERDSAAGPAAVPAPAAPQASVPDHSTTNTHEAGVDEPDLAKTDGRRLVTLAGGRLRVVDLASRRVTTVRGLPDGYSEQLLLQGDRALVIVPYGIGRGPEEVDRPAGARFVLVDLTGAGRVLGSLTVDGSFVDARQVGPVARVVVRSGPRLRFPVPGGGPYGVPGSPGRMDEARARRANLQALARSSIDDWLPRYELDRGGERQEGRLVPCERLSRPTAYTGSSMLTVLTLDLAGTLGTGDPVGIVADGDTVYSTQSTLYVAARQFPPAVPVPDRPVSSAPVPPAAAASQRTEIHQFDVTGAARPRYLASGSVAGWLLDQYSMSDYDGRLRVATTLDTAGSECCDKPSAAQSAVTVLARRGDRLVQVGRLGGLGKGERIYAVRFLGPVGYVVTFRQIDPLYTVDLSDPAHPRAVGELKITGYSAYLHPVGGTLLLGVGQEASAEGRRLGTQVSLFDVGDPARPRRVAQYHLRDGQSEVEFDPHAFLYWPASGLTVLPVNTPYAVEGGGTAVPPAPGDAGGSDGAVGTAVPVPPDRPVPAPGPVAGSGALVLRVHDGTLDRVGMVRQPGGAPIRRSLVVGDSLWTVSDTGVGAVSTGDLARQAWVPFG